MMSSRKTDDKKPPTPMCSLACDNKIALMNQISLHTPTKRVCITREQKRLQAKRRKRREWEAFQRNIARTTAAAVSMQEQVKESPQRNVFVLY